MAVNEVRSTQIEMAIGEVGSGGALGFTRAVCRHVGAEHGCDFVGIHDVRYRAVGASADGDRVVFDVTYRLGPVHDTDDAAKADSMVSPTAPPAV